MPKKYTTTEEIEKAWERKRERDRKAQATYIAKNHDLHLARMKEQYAKKKEAKKKEGAEEVRRVGKITSDEVKAYKQRNPDATQKQIAVALGVGQATVSRLLK